MRKEQLLITVTTEDAKYNQMTVENEANAWRARLAKVPDTVIITVDDYGSERTTMEGKLLLLKRGLRGLTDGYGRR